MEYWKSYCSVHPYEAITNLCAEQSCLAGLCATCICSHNELHHRKGTLPQYENIKTSYQRLNDRLKSQIEKIQGDKQRLQDLQLSIDERRNNVFKTMRLAREDCLNLVKKHFDELEGRVEAEITLQAKKHDLHNPYRLDSLNTLLLKEISSLLLFSKDLASPKFIDCILPLENEVMVNSEEFHRRVGLELSDNELYSSGVNYRSEYLTEVELSLKKLLSIEFVLPSHEFLNDFKETQLPRRSNSAVKKGFSHTAPNPFCDSNQFRTSLLQTRPNNSQMPKLEILTWKKKDQAPCRTDAQAKINRFIPGVANKENCSGPVSYFANSSTYSRHQ